MKLLTTALLVALSVGAYADTATDVKSVILENFEHTKNEDFEAVMGDVHSQSPAYLQTQQILQQLFPVYDLQYELVSYTFIGEDNEYAYAKVKQRTKKISGPAFQDNEVEVLMIFKKENDAWKLWTQANLAIEYL